MNSSVYKWCAVPQCKNTSIKTPNKLFFYVPNKEKLRKKWLKLARRDPASVSLKTSIYFCEDHFDLPNDMQNYMQFHIMGSVSRIITKPGCTPTKFECQPDRKKSNAAERAYMLKKRKMDIVKRRNELEEAIIKESLLLEDSPSESSDLNSDSKKKSLKKIALPTQNLPKESASHGKDQAQFIASSIEGNIQKAKFSKRKAITSLDTDDSSLEKKMKHVPMILKKKKSVINTSTSANLILNIPEEESINNFIEGEENENPVALEHEVCLNEEEQFDIPFVGIKEERGDTFGNENCLSEGNHIDKILLAIKQEYDETIDIKTEPEYVDFVNDLNLDNDHEYLVDLQNNIKIENAIKMEKVEEV